MVSMVSIFYLINYSVLYLLSLLYLFTLSLKHLGKEKLIDRLLKFYW